MTRKELAKEIFQISYIKGNFTLRSGLKSQEYFDKYRFESQPRLLAAIAEQMLELIPKDTEVLAGLELGGVPLATAIGLRSGLPVVFVRKQAKEYGTCQVAEGLDVKGKRVCIIEDVITTGGQVVESSQDLKSLGAQLNQVVCVIYRGEGGKPILKGSDLKVASLFTMAELKNS